MKIYFHGKIRVKAAGVLGMMIALMVLGLSSSAFAALGASLDSVQNDQVRLHANTKITVAGAYTIHEMTTPMGTVVREYVSPSGRVFGVTWQGPFVPDLQQLLGSYFEKYSQAAKSQREHHVGRWPLNIQEPGLVVQTAGHMRAYAGRAYDPGLFPAGVGGHDIR
jgi:hypothetical protein